MAILSICNANALSIDIENNCPTGTTTLYLEHGTITIEECVECTGITLTGCPCQESCENIPDTISCSCDQGYHSEITNTATGYCDCVANCDAGYYGGGDTCTQCPSPGTSVEEECMTVLGMTSCINYNSKKQVALSARARQLPTQAAHTSLRLIVIGQNNTLFPPDDGWEHRIYCVAQLGI